MTDMIERVARAMFERELDNGPWEQRTETQEAIYMADARAAIKAMREPTQEMRLAAVAEWCRPDPLPEHGSTLVFNAIWQAMIDEALK